jgi:hypothetical protein
LSFSTVTIFIGRMKGSFRGLINRGISIYFAAAL